MKRLLKAAAALVCAFGFTLAHAQLTTITASSISMGGVPIAAGTVTLTPVNLSGIPIAFATGGGGLNAPAAFSCTITAGAIAGGCQIPDSALTSPANILYSVQITNTGTQKSFTLQQVANITGTTWALDHYGPPSPTTNVQATQVAYGTAAPPASCVTPSFYVRNNSGGLLYICVAGSFVEVTGGGGGGSSYTFTAPLVDTDGTVAPTFGTAANTFAQGNDSRIVGAEQAAHKGAASGYAALDSGSHLLAANVPAYTGDVTSAAGSTVNTLATVNSNVGACGDATHVSQVTLDAKGRATACAAVAITSAGTVNASAMQSALSGATGCTTAGYFWSPQSNTCLAAGSGTNPGATPALYAWSGSAWVAATAAQVQSALSSDTVNSSSLTFSTGSGGDSTCPAIASGKDLLCMKGGQVNYSHNGGAYAPLPTAPTASSINTLLATLTGCSTTGYLYSPQSGTCVAPGSVNPMVVPRDANYRIAVVSPGTSKYDGLGNSWYWGIGSATPAWNTTVDSGGHVSATLATGTTANTAVGWSSSRDILAVNPSFKIVAGISSNTGVDAWIGLADQFSFYGTVDPGTTLGIGLVGFRYFAGTDTDWTCYSSKGGVYAGTTYDSGVAVDTTKQQVFDVIFTAQSPKFYIDGTRVCAAMTLTDVLDTTAPVAAVFSVQNTTTTSITASNSEAYYGAN